MGCRWITETGYLVLFALVIMASNVVWARSATFSPNLALTAQEQATRLRNLATAEVIRRLHPTGVERAGRVRPMPFYQRSYRGPWLVASLNERVRLAERIGEQGRARFAAERGMARLFGSRNKAIPQGPDSVNWNPRSGRVVVLEAKGGGSPLKRSFNSSQGTNLNTVRSARNVLTRYRRSASHAMKVQMARVILAAEKGQLDTGVVRTRHVLGEPKSPGLAFWDSTRVAREARRARREIIRMDPDAKGYFREAGRDHFRDRKAFRAARRIPGLRSRATQGMRVVGAAGALGLGWDAYLQSRTAWLMHEDPALKDSVLPYMQTGVAVGRAAQAATLVGRLAEPPRMLSLSTKSAAARVAGRAFLPITLGVESLQLATAYHEYGVGRISRREFYQRSAGTAILAGFTLGGAAIGGIVGFQVAGAGAIPGAVAGANVGAFAAIPVQLATDYMVNWYYRDFDERQLQTVNEAVERFYGLEARNDAAHN